MVEEGVGTPDAAAGVEETESDYLISMENACGEEKESNVPVKEGILSILA